MSSADLETPFDELLAHADWVRGLARRLVLDAARADDLVQETWVVALERPPSHADNLRAWLGSVVTSLAKSGWRSDARRGRREERGARPEALPSTEELVEEAARSRELVDHVLALDEPYRGVLLRRYFKDRTPTQIARELGRPVATVKTWLQRGHAQLRERLDAEYGDRRAWCAALLPLAQGAVPTAGAASLLPLGLAAAALVLAALWAVGALDVDDAARAPLMEESLAPEIASRPGGTTTGGDLVGAAGPHLDRTATAPVGDDGDEVVATESSAEGEALLLRGRLVDLNGEPLAGVELEWIDPGRLSWSDGARTVITGPRTYLQVGHEQQERLLADPAELERWAAGHFPRPDLASALLRGEAPPSYRAVSSAEGAVELRVPQGGSALVSRDPNWAVIGRSALRQGDGLDLWIAGRRQTVLGRVVDADGAACPDLEVTLRSAYPQELAELFAVGRGFLSAQSTVRTDELGRFRFERAPFARVNYLLAERAEGERVYRAVKGAGVDFEAPAIEVSLQLSRATVRKRVHGRVFTDAGEPSPRTTVVWGREVTETDAEGRYALELVGLEGELFAVRPGWGIAENLEAGAGLDPEALDQQGPDLRLPSGSLEIRGRVLAADGTPVAGATVGLLRATNHPGEPSYLEDLAAGRGLGYVETDGEGRFTIDGLRGTVDYRLRAEAGGLHAQSEPTRPGTVGLELVLND